MPSRKPILKYQNMTIMGDFNIDLKTQGRDFNKLDEFCDLFNLTNLIKSETCFTKSHKSLINLFLTSKPSSFQKMHLPERGFSDYSVAICRCLKCSFSSSGSFGLFLPRSVPATLISIHIRSTAHSQILWPFISIFFR